MTTPPKPPRNRDQELPRRKGEVIDHDREREPERDKTPDTPPTEPTPVPVKNRPRRGRSQARTSPGERAQSERSAQ